MNELKQLIIEGLEKRIRTEKDLLNKLDLLILKIKLQSERDS